MHISEGKQKICTVDITDTTINYRFQITNHLGSSSIELDDLGNIISYEEYHPFGTTSYRSGRSEAEVSLKRYKYVMKELDNETGLYYYGMRYYAPWLARFVSSDPLQVKYPMLTPYQYSSNSPITMIDVDGLEGVYVQPDGMSKIKFNDLRKLEKEGLNWTLLKDANLLENLESPFIDIENKAQYIWCPEMIREGSGKKGAVISIDNLTGEDFFKVPELPVEIAEVETEKPVETEIPEKSKIKKIGNVPIDDIPEEGSVIFTKEIFFIQNSNEFKDYTSAKEDLDEIVQIMNDYPEYTLSIFGNIGTNNKSTTIDSKTTFTDINTGKIVDSTIGELMNIRAKRIYNYLIKEGIDASRLNYGQGAIYNNTTGLKTSFVLKN